MSRGSGGPPVRRFRFERGHGTARSFNLPAVSATRLAAALLPIALASCAAPADIQSETASAGTIIRSGCRQGQCSWLRVLGVADAENSAQGRLLRITARAGTSIHRDGSVPALPPQGAIQWEASDRTDYAFCSLRRPAYAFSDGEGGLIVHFLDFHALAGYQLASAGLYMRFCHGRETVPQRDALSALGYRPGTRSEQVESRDVGVLTRF